jgi:rubrerythrin
MADFDAESPEERVAGPGESIDSGKGRVFPCDECGADLQFAIGTQSLKCPFCGAVKQIEIAEDAEIVEHDYRAMLEQLKSQKQEPVPDDGVDEHAVRCSSCGADVVFQGTLTSTQCPYCASPLQRDKIHDAPSRVAVDGVLPFQIAEPDAAERLRTWVKSLWWAPNEFKKQGVRGKFNGIYLPYYTFDSLTYTKWSGQRGDYYYVTVGSGKDQRTERRTSWSYRAGEFERFFDDVLVVATTVQKKNLMERLEPWPLEKCIPYTPHVLAGLFARTYDVSLNDGFGLARERMDSAITSEVRQRIGGDEQSITSQKTVHRNVTFKHLLLPVWLMAYRYKDKPYRVVINAVTGEVSGERPYSVVKIVSAIVAGLAVAAAVWWLFQQQNG